MPWAGRAFQALDCDNRGYLLKHEILQQIDKAGVSSHLQLVSLIQALERKRQDEAISYQEWDQLI
jgi:hypothetical protein